MTISRRELLRTTPAMLLAAGWAGHGGPAEAAFEEFTKRSHESVERGNHWLKKTFNRDGGCGVDIGQATDISCTAMVGLSMLSQGNTPIEGPLAGRLRKLTQYLTSAVRLSKFNTSLNTQVKADLSGYADHHFAALYLSQALGEGWTVESVKSALNLLIAQIASGQQSEGHWGQGRYPRLGAVTGWVSLRGAHFAGLNVRASAQRTAEYLIAQMKGKKGRSTRELFPLSSGIRVLYAMGMENEPVAESAFKTALELATKDFNSLQQFGGEHYLAFHFINETMLQRGGDMWQKWFSVVRDKIISVQNRDGSWTGHSCITSRTFCTACALLVLTSPNRYLPISQP